MLFAAPSAYQCVAVGPGVGPNFQYFSFAAMAVGNVTCIVIEPVQPVVENWNRPSGKLTPPGGGDGGPTNDAAANEHCAPPPERIAVAVPVLVDVMPLNVVTTLAARLTAIVYVCVDVPSCAVTTTVTGVDDPGAPSAIAPDGEPLVTDDPFTFTAAFTSDVVGVIVTDVTALPTASE